MKIVEMDQTSISNTYNSHLRSCRACLTYTGDEFFYLLDLLYEPDDETDGLDALPTQLDCFNKCTQLQVTEQQLKAETWTARYLCKSCRVELERAYHFINKAQLSDQMLKKQAYSLKTKHKEKIDDRNLVILDEQQCITLDEEDELMLYKREIIEEEEQSGIDSNLNACENIEIELQRESCKDFYNDTLDQVIDEIGDTKETTVAVEENDNYSNFEFEIEQLDDYFEDTISDIQQSEENNTSECNLDDEDTLDSACNQKNVQNSCEKKRRTKYFEFDCELCPEKFTYQSELMQHYDTHHSDDANMHFQCETCLKCCVTTVALRIHIRQKHMDSKYVDCNKCGRMVLNSFYKVHLQRHNKKLKFLCSQCPNIFSSKHLLMKHMEYHSTERDRKIKCTKCEREFYTLENLHSHMVVHKTERVSYTCPLCSKTFLRHNNLKLHMQWHRGETKSCPHCDKKFVSNKDLEVHIRFHTGNFPYPCPKCDRRFAIKSHINDHLKKHEGIRYKCSQCDKEFINMSGLKQHSYEHTSMPYACNVCKRGFPTKFKIRRHLRSVHKELFLDVYTAELANLYIVENCKDLRNAQISQNDDYIDMVEVLEEEGDELLRA